jgi:hypothetical protein
MVNDGFTIGAPARTRRARSAACRRADRTRATIRIFAKFAAHSHRIRRKPQGCGEPRLQPPLLVCSKSGTQGRAGIAS